MQDLSTYVESYFGIAGKDFSSIEHLFDYIDISKGSDLFKINGHVHDLYFIQDGFIRMHRYDFDQEREVTQWIGTCGHFITDLPAFIFDTQARFNFTAISDCLCYRIKRSDYNRIVDFIPQWPSLERMFLTKCFATMEDRIYSLISKKAEDKYKDCMTYTPELFQAVPLQYIASMLGMTPETLSRMRKNYIS